MVFAFVLITLDVPNEGPPSSTASCILPAVTASSAILAVTIASSAISAATTVPSAIFAAVIALSAIFAVVTFASTIFAVVTVASAGAGTSKVSQICLKNITSPDVTPASVSVVPLNEYAETACSTP